MARIHNSVNKKGTIKRCRAKISAADQAATSNDDLDLVRWIIRGTFVDETNNKYFSPLLTFTHGRLEGPCIESHNNAWRVNTTSYSRALCAAVRAGVIDSENIAIVLDTEVKHPMWDHWFMYTDKVRERESDKYIPMLDHIKNEHIEQWCDLYLGVGNWNYRTRREWWERYKEISTGPSDTKEQGESEGNGGGEERTYGYGDNREDGGNEEAREILGEEKEEPFVPTGQTQTHTPPLGDSDQWYAWLEEVEKYLGSGDVPQSDDISNPTFERGMAMIAVGIPLVAVKDAYAKTWPETMRVAMGVRSYDPRTFGTPREGEHKVTPYVDALILAGVPPFLVGPTQAGKGYLANNTAERRELTFGSVPCNAGISVAWFMGRNMPEGFISTDFIRAYSEGGVFLFDEIDSADSNILLLVNDSLSNKYLRNPVRDVTYEKHPNFIPMAAANTYGLGADPKYSGRERLDGATLERFRMGRTFVDYDRDLQRALGLKRYAEVKAAVNGTETEV